MQVQRLDQTESNLDPNVSLFKLGSTVPFVNSDETRTDRRVHANKFKFICHLIEIIGSNIKFNEIY